MKKGLLLLVLLPNLLLAQLDASYYLDSNHPYDPKIPTPASVLGYEVGQWHVSHDKLVQYMTILAASSDRVTIENRGKTYEDRPLLLLTITHPDNHQNIGQIQKQHLQLSEPSGSSLALETMPLVVYQGFSIHGNEPSGANAGLLAAYHLVASQAPETEQLLQDVVILFDPSYNPDGLQRFAYWANTNKNQNLTTDNNDREYSEVWPRGRTNHYHFDLNRDWLPAQLPESQARIESFTNWLPNILTDHHEMGTDATFFFQPGIQSRVHPLTPKMNQTLTKEIGTYHAEALNKIGSLYYTEESYDDFYYGKGSTYPDVNGSIGILFEQASSRGHIQDSDNGVLTFPFTVRNQLTAAFSTLKAAQNMRVKLLRYMRDFYKDARQEAAKNKSKAIVFGQTKDPVSAYKLAEILERHKIKVHRLNKPFTHKGKTYHPETSYVVPLEQKKNKLIRGMFEKRTQFEDSLFYDISGWTFPLAFNLQYDFVNNTSMAGAQIEKLTTPEGSITSTSNYAYLFEAHGYDTPAALYELMEAGIRIKTALKPFASEGTAFDYGTYMIPVQNQNLSGEALTQKLAAVAKKYSLKVTGVNTGLMKGIDLGSQLFITLELPKIAMLVGDGVRSYDAGEIWHLFDTRYNIPLTKIDIRDLSRIDLSGYTHFILPSYSGEWLDYFADKFKEYTEEGGTLIGFRYSLDWLQKHKFIDVEIKSFERNATGVRFDQKRDWEGAQNIGGAIFNTRIDRSHPINFGVAGNSLPMFRDTSIFIKPNANSYNNPIQYTNTPLLSGYISEEKLELLKRSVPFQTQGKGEGRVIIFTDNTNFRAFWYGTNRLLANAIFLSKAM